ncbi:MAG TPA: hypothetical protein VHD57_11680 [Vicinamibacterales bacterium]|jgi:hypothetical protein|nr:hypothetical protein [Vicinamibacterales bacterium]
MTHPVRYAAASEAEIRESVLERLEVREALDGNRDVRVVRHSGERASSSSSGFSCRDHRQVFTIPPDGKRLAFSSSRMGFKDEGVNTEAPQPYGEIFVMDAAPPGSTSKAIILAR